MGLRRQDHAAHGISTGPDPKNRYLPTLCDVREKICPDSSDNSGAVRFVRSTPDGLALIFSPKPLLDERLETLTPALRVSRLPHQVLTFT